MVRLLERKINSIHVQAYLELQLILDGISKATFDYSDVIFAMMDHSVEEKKNKQCQN